MSARLREHKTGTAYPVLVVDDHALFSTSLTLALRGKGFDAQTIIVARVEDYLSRQAATPAGLVVLDLDLGGDPDGERVDWARLIDSFRARDWMTLVVSGNEDWSGVAAVIAAGAIGFVPKSQSFGELLRMVVTAAQGVPVMTDAEHRVWLERHRNYFARVGSRSRRIACLSAREREVMELLAEGKRAAAIAEHFVVSMPTVRAEIRSILTKLEVGSQIEAVVLFRQQQETQHRPGIHRS